MDERNEFNNVIGKTVAEARGMHPNWLFRVTNHNGSPCLCTRDMRYNRVNVSVVDDLITEIRGIG